MWVHDCEGQNDFRVYSLILMIVHTNSLLVTLCVCVCVCGVRQKCMHNISLMMHVITSTKGEFIKSVDILYTKYSGSSIHSVDFILRITKIEA
jgi:hypothetical protein